MVALSMLFMSLFVRPVVKTWVATLVVILLDSIVKLTPPSPATLRLILRKLWLVILVYCPRRALTRTFPVVKVGTVMLLVVIKVVARWLSKRLLLWQLLQLRHPVPVAQLVRDGWVSYWAVVQLWEWALVPGTWTYIGALAACFLKMLSLTIKGLGLRWVAETVLVGWCPDNRLVTKVLLIGSLGYRLLTIMLTEGLRSLLNRATSIRPLKAPPMSLFFV